MAKITIFEEQSVSFVYSDIFGAWITDVAYETVPLVIGETYTICWNGEEYTRTAFDANSFSRGAVAIGNPAFIGGEPDPEGLIFLLGYSPIDGGMIMASAAEVNSVTVGVTMEIEGEEIVPVNVVTGFAANEDGVYGASAEGELFNLEAGSEYKVMLDGLVYDVTAIATSMDDGQAQVTYIGNSDAVTGGNFTDTDPPFAIAIYTIADQGITRTIFATSIEGEEHFIGIYKVGGPVVEEVVIYSVTSTSLKAVGNAIRKRAGITTQLSFPDGMVKAIGNITGGGGSGGGSSDDVRYVTFKNGSDSIFVKPVAVGDDCVDVYAKGMIEVPTKASTIDTVYTYSGWSTTNGGAADGDALKEVTENRTVYAAYTSAVRQYTITYYDDDGVTVLKTEQLDYGSTPSYKPSKTGYIIDGWTPAFSTVTGDASYTAAWTTKLTFAEATWEDIARISENGTASLHFSLGDSRTININGSTAEIFIAGFDHDNKADGSGKAGITVLTRHIVPNLKATPKYATGTTTSTFDASTIDSAASGLYSTLDADLKAVIKRVAKQYDKGRNCVLADSSVTTYGRYIWVPSAQETGKTITSGIRAWLNTLGTKYAHIPTYLGTTPEYPNSSNRYWARNLAYQSASFTRNVYYDISHGYTYDGSTNGQEQNLIVGFCI